MNPCSDMMNITGKGFKYSLCLASKLRILKHQKIIDKRKYAT